MSLDEWRGLMKDRRPHAPGETERDLTGVRGGKVV